MIHQNGLVIARMDSARDKLAISYLTKRGRGNSEASRAEGLREWTPVFGLFDEATQTFIMSEDIEVWHDKHPAHKQALANALETYKDDESKVYTMPISTVVKYESIRQVDWSNLDGKGTDDGGLGLE